LKRWEIDWKDYYKILQIRPSADFEVIQASYKKLARKYHPDLDTSTIANQRMKDINEAYEVLENPAERKEYDLTYQEKSKKNLEIISDRLPQKQTERKPASSKPKPARHIRKKYVVWGAILLVLITVAAVWTLIVLNKPILAETGNTVKVDYVLKLADGTMVDSSEDRGPFEFTIGNNEVIPGFEKAVTGMKAGEKKTVSIQPADGYGEYDASLVTTIDKSLLPATITPEVGQTISGTNSSGQTMYAIIKSINDDGTITVDANNPLAGEVLTFDITLVEIEKK
jgi:peptidylprolyl isomerase